MKATLNYTGRKRIPASKIEVTVQEDEDGVRRCNLDVDFKGLELPSAAHVFLEAYYQRAFMRFNFGTVENLTPPDDRRLTLIDVGDKVFFRVKVAEHYTDQPTRILASADRITPNRAGDTPENRIPLLPVQHCHNLGQLVWRCAFTADAGPTLEVNSNIWNMRDIVKSDKIFFSLVFPAVVKEVLTRVVSEEVDPDDDSWGALWLQWLGSFYRVPIPTPEVDADGREAWVDDAVLAFAHRFSAADRYDGAVRGGGS